LQARAHLVVVAHLWHDDVAPDALQLVEVEHQVGHALVGLVEYDADPVARLDFAEHLTIALGIDDVVGHGVAAVAGQ
jgi:hypothetical protein